MTDQEYAEAHYALLCLDYATEQLDLTLQTEDPRFSEVAISLYDTAGEAFLRACDKAAK